ncbi:MAG TPA: protein kinase [Streptosporangiaceae bacterium]|nr:protein kinase [Streptosporangiaceae bacterium]
MVSDEVPGTGDDRPPEPARPLAAGSRVAGYRLQEQIGQGGMAVVYRAEDERLGRLVALKVLTPALANDAQFRQRFVRESRAAAAVDDPHIIPIYEAGEAGGALYIAMRYVRGGDVRTLVSRTGPLSPARAAAIISSVASALDAAHAAGLLHRDVKPANMLLDPQTGRPDHVYLSDFGLSKAWQGATRLTGTGLYLGTLDYSAPEQIEGRPMDGRTDQYALACAAFELLAGEPPFRAPEPLAVMYAQVSAPPPLLTARRAGLPAAVDRVLARALAKSPAQRYASCGELARELGAALGLPGYAAGDAARPPGRAATEPASPGRATPATPSGRPPYQPAAPPPYQPAAGPTWPPAAEPGPATVEQAGAAGGRSRARLLVTAIVAGLLVAGGVSAAFALAGGHKPQHLQAGSTSTHGGPTHSVVTQSSPSPTTPTQSTPTQSASASPSSAGQTTPVTVPLSQVKVCTFPADTCTSANPTQMKTEPAQIVTTGDGSGFLKNLTWSGWGQPTAQGTGVLEVDNCTPSCAQGTYTGYPATVTLTGLTPYGNGNDAYANMTVSAPTSPYQPQPFTHGLVP